MTEHLFDPAPYTTDESSQCIDCGVAATAVVGPWEYFMLHDSIWQAAGMKPRDLPCIGCLEP